MGGMNLTTLHQVLAVCQHGSFASAARALGVSQPNLSKNVARLEDELKGRIYHRTAAGCELTPFGQVVVEQAERVIREAETLVQAAQLATGGPASLLRIGFGTELKRRFAPQLLAAILDRRPHLNLRVEIGDRHRLLPALRSRELDVIFCIVDDAVAEHGALVSPFLSTFGVVVAAPSHPLASEPEVSPERFLRFAHAGPRNPSFTSRALFGIDSTAGAGARYELSDFEPFLPLVFAGRSTILLPAFEAEHYVATGALVQLNLPLSARLDYACVTTAAASTFPIVVEVLEAARAIGNDITLAQDRLWRI